MNADKFNKINISRIRENKLNRKIIQFLSKNDFSSYSREYLNERIDKQNILGSHPDNSMNAIIISQRVKRSLIPPFDASSRRPDKLNAWCIIAKLRGLRRIGSHGHRKA